MKPIHLINIMILKKCIRMLNESHLLEKSIDPFGMSFPEMIQTFAYRIENLPKAKQRKVPAPVIEFYNYLFEDESKEGKGNYKHLPNISEFGNREGTQCYIIDIMLLKGGFTLEEFTRACNTNKHRIHRHMLVMKRKFNKKVIRMDGKYYIRDNDEVKQEGKMLKGLLE